MKKGFIILFFVFYSFPVLAQNDRSIRTIQSDGEGYYISDIPRIPESSLITVRSFGENTFYYSGAPVSRSYVTALVAQHPEAYRMMRRANTNYAFALTVGFLGGASLGWGIADLIWNNSGWGFVAAGSGMLLIMIPFLKGYNRCSQKAVDLYNEGLGLSSSFRKRKPVLTAANSGFGLALKF